ncbi:MAG: O-antigen ligase family protein [Eubacterium sp.]
MKNEKLTVTKNNVIEGNFKKKSKSLWVLAFLILSTCFGEFLNLFNIKLSWIIAILLLITYLFKKNENEKIYDNTSKYFIAFMFFWVIYGLVQLAVLFLNNLNGVSYASYISLLINVYIVIMICLNVRNVSDIIFLNYALVIGLVFNLMLSIWEINTGQHLIPLTSEVDLLFFRNQARTVFGNPNDLATFINLGLIALIINYLLTKKYLFFTTTILITSIIILININSRANLLGLELLFVFWIVFGGLNLLYVKSKRIFYIVVTVIVTSLSIVIIVLLSKTNLEQIILKLSGNGDVTSDLFRLSLTKKSFVLLLNSMFLGVGPGQSVALLGINVHNFFLEILSEYGIFIFLGLIIIFYSLLMAYKSRLFIRISSFIMAFVPTFIVIGVSSSGANRIRATWIIITLLYLLVMKNQATNFNK